MKRHFPAWIVPVIVVFAIATVWLRLTIVRTTYAINQTDKMIDNAKRELERASLKTAGLRSPRRLEILAKQKFNLSQPRADQVVYLK